MQNEIDPNVIRKLQALLESQVTLMQELDRRCRELKETFDKFGKFPVKERAWDTLKRTDKDEPGQMNEPYSDYLNKAGY